MDVIIIINNINACNYYQYIYIFLLSFDLIAMDNCNG